LRTIFLHSHWRKQCTDIQRERKRVDSGLKLKVSTVDIRIKKLGLMVIHSKVPSSGLRFTETSGLQFTETPGLRFIDTTGLRFTETTG